MPVHPYAVTSAAGDRSAAAMYDRRPLRSYPLTPPDYLIDPQILLEDYVEKEVRYAGGVPDVSVDVDVTNRTAVLKIIDRGKKSGLIPWHTNFEQDAVFSLSAHNIKISRRHSEDLLLRVPIHEIAATCYIRDDGQHILAIKHGDPERWECCHLAVLYCDSKTSAEEVCALVGQCFQLVYTEATMQFFDRELQIASNGLSYDSSTTRSDSSTITKPGAYDHQTSPAFMTRSNPDLHSMPSTLPQSMPRSHRTPSTTSELSAPSTELLQDYMKKLHRKLSLEELKQFATFLKNKRGSLPFTDFCDRVLSLFGQDRKHLMAGMWPFIAERDYAYFEEFLEKNGISLPESGRGTISSLRSYPYSRALSESSNTNGAAPNGPAYGLLSADEFDRIVDHVITHEISDNLDNSFEHSAILSDVYMSPS